MKPSNSHEILEDARRVLEVERDAVASLIHRIGPTFLKALRFLETCRGRIVVVGMGKSGLVGRKISATFSSTGSPAIFLNPAEGMHGDFGAIMRRDVILAISYSGQTREMSQLLPVVKDLSLKFIAMTANPRSILARGADVVLDISVRREATELMVPTASTTAALALGDALAVCLLRRKGLLRKDFARLHPGGALPKKLLLRVEDLMHGGSENPVVTQSASVRQALLVMTRSRLGAVSVVNGRGRLVGYFTDGDLRRHLQKEGETLLRWPLEKVMTRGPKTIRLSRFASDAAEILKSHPFDNMPVVDGQGRPVGIIDERDLLEEGIT